MRWKLDTVIVAIEAHSDAQSAAIVSTVHTKERHAKRRSLIRNHMAPIATIARHSASEEPALEAIRVPLQCASMQTLANSAWQMAENAERRAGVFIAAGLQSDFVARLHDTINGFLESAQDRANTLTRARAATRGIRFMLAEGRRQVQILDTLVRIALAGDDPLLTGWRRAIRVVKSS